MRRGDENKAGRGRTLVVRLRERVNLSMSQRELDELTAEWVSGRVEAELRGLAIEELVVAARMGLDLGPKALEDLEDLAISAETLRRMPAAGYEHLLDAFGDARRREAPPDDVVRRWQAAYGGFIARREDVNVLHLPLGTGVWALCDGARLWRVEGNPFRGG